MQNLCTEKSLGGFGFEDLVLFYYYNKNVTHLNVEALLVSTASCSR